MVHCSGTGVSVDGQKKPNELGMSDDVVMKLASTFPEGQNYKVYGDNFFTCVPLVVQLLDHGLHFVGTVRQERLPNNCNLEDEKILKKKGRGSFDIRVEANHNICAVKWYDNRAVSSFVLSHLYHPMLAQNLSKRFNAGTKPPNH